MAVHLTMTCCCLWCVLALFTERLDFASTEHHLYNKALMVSEDLWKTVEFCALDKTIT